MIRGYTVMYSYSWPAWHSLSRLYWWYFYQYPLECSICSRESVDFPISYYFINTIASSLNNAAITELNTASNVILFNVTGLLPGTTNELTIIWCQCLGEVIWLPRVNPAILWLWQQQLIQVHNIIDITVFRNESQYVLQQCWWCSRSWQKPPYM